MANSKGSKMFTGAPFGTQKTRFDISAVHPQRKLPGTYTEVPYCRVATARETRLRGPGSYNIESGSFTDRSVRNMAAGPNWRTAFESAKLSTIPHMLYKDEWHQKKRLNEMLGPGRYNLQDFIEIYNKRPMSNRGVCQSTGLRMQSQSKYKAELPGPGTYGEGGDPWRKFDEKCKKSFCTVGVMEGGCGRQNSSRMNNGSGLAPGSYRHKDLLQETLNKTISIRGPYDLCSGPRIPSHKRGKANPLLAPGRYEIQPYTEMLKDIHHKKKGLFSSMAQYPIPPTERIFCNTLSQWPRNEKEPGPGYYEHEKPVSAPPNRYSFNSSATRFKKISKKNISRIGPGQYNINRWHQSQHKNGNTSVFQSDKSRLPSALSPREQLLNEKIHPKHVNDVNQQLLVPVEAHLTGIRT